MPRSDQYISSLFGNRSSRSFVRSRILTPLEADSAASGLSADTGDFYYSGWVSFIDALQAINRGFFTWSIVKLYYSVFYTVRASLAVDDVCGFHVGNSHYTILARSGQMPVSCAEHGTHKSVMKAFQRRNPNHPLISQQIELSEAMDWFIEKRESANYGEARFSEPNCGSEFDQILRIGLRKAVNAYLVESSLMFVFDADHAILAYPLRALQLIGNQLLPRRLARVSREELQFLERRAKDDSGNLASLCCEIKRLTMVQ